MLSQLKQFVSPPNFLDDPDKTAVAKILNLILLILFTANLLIIGLVFIWSGGFSSRVSLAFFSLLGIGSIKYLVMRGQVTLSSWLIILLLWCVTVLSLISTGGVQAPGYVMLAFFVVLAGVLLGWHIAILMTILNSAVGLVFLWMAEQGILPYSLLPQDSFRVWFFFSLTSLVMVLLLHVGLGSIREALARAQSELRQREQAEAENLQAREDLRQRETQLRTIVNNLPFWVWLKDVNGRFLIVNNALAQTGPGSEREEELLGKTGFDFTLPELAQKYLDDEQKVMESGQSLSIEEPVFVHEEIRLYETYKAPYVDDDNQLLGTFGFARDITQRKQDEITLLESEARFRSIFEDAAIGMVLVDLDHAIVKTNYAFAHMLGYLEAELIGKSFKEITYDDDVEISLDHHRRLLAGELQSYQFEKRYLHKQGNIVWAMLNVSLVYSAEGVPAQAIAQVQNIDDRKRAEADREMLIQELERRNAELERFAYTVSHDLKSPLVTIGGFLGFLERDAESGDFEQLRADIDSIRSAADKMRLLLDELLELSRIGRLMNQPERVPFAQIVQDALALTHGQLTNCEVRVLGESLPMVMGDRVRLVEVVQNLLDNAAKFMGEQPQPCITIGVRPDEECPVFFVQDNGIGIPPQHHDKIFDIFNKLNPDVAGTGIGLALVKRIVEVHNGRLWVESEGMGQGSTFCFILNESTLLGLEA